MKLLMSTTPGKSLEKPEMILIRVAKIEGVYVPLFMMFLIMRME